MNEELVPERHLRDALEGMRKMIEHVPDFVREEGELDTYVENAEEALTWSSLLEER